jgi:hypothetical protein
MNSAWRGFWKRWRARKQAEQLTTEEPSRQGDASTQNKEERSGGSDSQSGGPGELPRYPKELKALLWTKLGFGGSPRPAEEYPSPDENWERCAPLKNTYMTTMRARERQELEKRFEAFFGSCDDIRVGVSPLVETIRRERRICESEVLTDSLYLVELVERRLTNSDPEIMKAVGGAAMVRAGDVRAMLAEIFMLGGRGVRDLAAHFDTIHRLTPSLCECLHAALISSPGSTRQREEWEEFFLEPDRLAAEDAANGYPSANRDAGKILSADYQYQELFSLERALQVDRATKPSRAIKAMLDWPTSKPYFPDVRDHLAYFFAAFRRLPAAEQERVLPHLREAVFQELVPENPDLPWSWQESTTDRWFIQVLSLGEQPLALLFGEQNAQSVLALAGRARDERYEAGKHEAARNECETRQEERLKSIEEQLNYLSGSDRFEWRGEFDGEPALEHLLDLMLNVQEKTSVYIFHEGSYPICSKYCDLLWDKAVSAILLEQKVTIVQSAYEQWRWLELMRKLSITRLRSQHPERRLGWRW